MADNVAITAGTGTSIATDQIGSDHYQLIKLAYGPLDTATLVTASVGLPVSVVGTVPVSGTFWQATQPVSIASAVPVTDNSGSLTVDNAGTFATQATLTTGAINSGGTALTPKFAKIDAASSGANTILGAVSGKKIRVLSYRFQSAADVNVTFTDGSGGTALTGAMSTGAKGGGGGAAFSPVGHFETTANTILGLTLSSAVQVSGHLCYVEV